MCSQIRAYTAKDKFSETSWSQPISTDPDNTAILVGITVPVILIIVILLAFVLIRKLHCNNCTKSLSHYTDRQADLVSVSVYLCVHQGELEGWRDLPSQHRQRQLWVNRSPPVFAVT